MINNESTTIIDVREPWEFSAGHVEGTVNIPLGEVPSNVEEFKKMSKPLVLICASGNRSGQAANFLKARGVEDVHNGGGWRSVQLIKQMVM